MEVHGWQSETQDARHARSPFILHAKVIPKIRLKERSFCRSMSKDCDLVFLLTTGGGGRRNFQLWSLSPLAPLQNFMFMPGKEKLLFLVSTCCCKKRVVQTWVSLVSCYPNLDISSYQCEQLLISWFKDSSDLSAAPTRYSKVFLSPHSTLVLLSRPRPLHLHHRAVFPHRTIYLIEIPVTKICNKSAKNYI
jgi:hypothetical protein